MNIQNLRKFLVEANQAGYAAEDSRRWTREADGSLSISHSERDLSYHDNFFGGDPFGGRILVAQSNKPIWMMVYYGWVRPDIEANQVFQFLRSALRNMPLELPLRGPSAFKAQHMEYFNQCHGDLAQYSGTETISQSVAQSVVQDVAQSVTQPRTQPGRPIYKCHYAGGWVDQRSAL